MAYDLADFESIYQAVESEVDNGETTDETKIKQLVNRVYRQCIRKILEINRDYFLTNATKATVASTKTYDFVDDWSIIDCMKPVALMDNGGTPLNRGSLRYDLRDYFWVGNGGVGFNPTPTSAQNYILWYIQRQSDLSATSDTPAFENTYWDGLVFGACYYYFIWKKSKKEAAYYKEDFAEWWKSFVSYIASTIDSREHIHIEDDGLD